MSKSISVEAIIKFLIGMVIVGSVIGIENSQSFGCVIGLEMLSISNLFFLIISSTLLFFALKSNSQKRVSALIAIEFSIWILKYLIYKGGYITGYGGTPNPINVTYDFIAITLRFLLLFKIVSQIKRKWIYAILISVIMVTVKVNLFALPWFTKKLWEIEDKNADKQRTEIIGEYIGNITQLSDNQTSRIEIKIDTSQLKIRNAPPFELKKEYLFEIDYPNTGYIGTNEGLVYDVKIENIKDDSLVFYLEDMLNKVYLVKLKTER